MEYDALLVQRGSGFLVLAIAHFCEFFQRQYSFDARAVAENPGRESFYFFRRAESRCFVTLDVINFFEGASEKFLLFPACGAPVGAVYFHSPIRETLRKLFGSRRDWLLNVSRAKKNYEKQSENNNRAQEKI